MNDEWSRCPICFEDYSSIHRPTTFNCGHSTCIDHAIGPRPLRYCPICRYPLKQETEYHVSYNLEEASRIFQLIKNKIDWSTIKISSPPVTHHEMNTAATMIKRDEIYARQLQAELNHEMNNTSLRRKRASARNRASPVVETTTHVAPLEINQDRGCQKDCGHRCDLVFTRRCCSCSDRRPHRQNEIYEAYVDGQGIINRAARNAYYCPTCKRS